MASIIHTEWYNWKGASFEAVDGDALLCRECDLSWCPHLEEIIREGCDTEDIFSEYHLEKTPYEFVVVVPIFPSVQLFYSAHLVRADFPVPAFEVHYYISEPHVGYLVQGEGRNNLRLMLLSQLNATVGNTPQCKAPSHQYKQEMKFQKNWKDPRTFPMEKWALVHEGKCLTCFQQSNGSGDFADLVPDQEPSPWSS